jgi:anti-anti-sigma factor
MDVVVHSPVAGAVVLAGEITSSSAPAVRSVLWSAVTRREARQLVVDLGGVTFLDCAGVGALIFGQNAARSLGYPFRVTNSDGVAQRVLDVLQLFEVAQVAPAAQDASPRVVAQPRPRSADPGEPGSPPPGPTPVRRQPPRPGRPTRREPGEPG